MESKRILKSFLDELQKKKFFCCCFNFSILFNVFKVPLTKIKFCYFLKKMKRQRKDKKMWQIFDFSLSNFFECFCLKFCFCYHVFDFFAGGLRSRLQRAIVPRGIGYYSRRWLKRRHPLKWGKHNEMAASIFFKRFSFFLKKLVRDFLFFWDNQVIYFCLEKYKFVGTKKTSKKWMEKCNFYFSFFSWKLYEMGVHRAPGVVVATPTPGSEPE